MDQELISVRVPPSKSLTQRAVVVASLARGRSRIQGVLRGDDLEALLRGLRAVGVPYCWLDDETLEVDGVCEIRPPDSFIELGNAGTAMRFLASWALLSKTPLHLTGVEAMKQRPMAGLLDGLGQMGVASRTHGLSGCPPISLTPPAHLPEARRIILDSEGSSQQLSSLLMVGPSLEGGLEIEVKNPVKSAPYIDLTLDVMKEFGIRVQRPSQDLYLVPEGPYKAARYQVEGDHSSASYIWAASWLSRKPVSIPNLRPDSMQGDRIFPEILNKIARPSDEVFHLGHVPDIAPTAAVCALFGRGTTTIASVEHLKIKESNRLLVLHEELSRINGRITLKEDGWVMRPGPLRGDTLLDPHLDHRMAMCFGLVGLRVPGIEVADPGCVTKSFPGFWQTLERFR